MLNLWICSSENEDETSDPGHPEPSDQWEPVQTHQIFQEHGAPCHRSVSRRQSSVLHSSEAGTDLSDIKITEVPVVSSYGSVADTKSKASGRNSLCHASSSREFYTRAQQQQIFLKAQYDLTRSQTTATSDEQHQGKNQSKYDDRSVHDNQSQGHADNNQPTPLYNHYDNQTHYDFRSRSHYGYGNNYGHVVPEPFSQAGNCDLIINNSIHQGQAPSVVPITTYSQYSYSEYTTSHHPSQCNDSASAYEYNNYSHPQDQTGSYYGSHSSNPAAIEPQWQASAQHLAPITQQGVPEYNLDDDLEVDFDPSVDFFQQDCDLSISDIDPINLDFGEKPQAALAPFQGSGTTQDATPNTANQFDEMYRNLCLFYKTYGHTNVPKITTWFLLGSWVDSLRKRKKFQILAKRGINVASHLAPPLTCEEIGLLENIGFEWTATTTASENEAIIASMNNVDKSIAEQAAATTCKTAPSAYPEPQVVLSGNVMEAPRPINLSLKSSVEKTEGTNFGNMSEQLWYTQFKRLVEFHRIHGTTTVPARYSPDPKLGHWVMTQRRQYQIMQSGKPSRMNKERIDLLEALAFQWSIRKDPEMMWRTRFSELVKYKEKNGNCLVPQRYGGNPQLGTWVNTQRRHFTLLKAGKKSCMTLVRRGALDKIGFFWSTASCHVDKVATKETPNATSK